MHNPRRHPERTTASYHNKATSVATKGGGEERNHELPTVQACRTISYSKGTLAIREGADCL
jgi:hypothetical protein